MVKRALAALLLLLVTLQAAPAIAETPVASTQQSLIDRYPPESLRFYTAPGWEHTVTRTINNVLAAMFDGVAGLVKWSAIALDHAWNANLARWFSGAIDAVARRFSILVWSFGGLLLALIGVWIAIQVWQGAVSRMTGGLIGLALVLVVAALTQPGVSSLVADVEDIAGDLAGQVLNSGAEGQAAAVTSMMDGIYRQLILENWARANFTDMDAARRHIKNGLPGGEYLGLTGDDAADKFDGIKGDARKDFLPWFDDNSISHRIAVVFATLLGTVPFVAGLLLLSLVVLGAKALTTLMAMGLPLALLFAAMPWFDGMRFLRGYIVWAFVGPILKTFASFMLAAYMAFLGALMSSAPSIPGGWATVTLVVLGLVVMVILVGRPILRLFASLIFRPEPARTHGAQKESKAGAQPNAQPPQRSGWQSPPGWTQAQAQAQARAQVQPPPKPLKLPPGPRYLQNPVGSAYQATGQRTRVHHHHHQAQNPVPEMSLIDLLREARRVVQVMSQAAQNAGSRK